MKKLSYLLIVCVAMWAVSMGCPAPKPPEEKKTESPADTGTKDSGQPDPGQKDDGQPDDGQPDPGQPDTGTPDPGKPDQGQPDKGQPDQGKPDQGQPDQGTPDQGKPEMPAEKPMPTDAGGEMTPDMPKAEMPAEKPMPTDAGVEMVPEMAPGDTVKPEMPAEMPGEKAAQNTPSAAAATQIQTVLAGTLGNIDGAAVTYLKPKVGNDPEGFFLQATNNGPAIFVVATLATLTPKVKVGDIVSLQVTKVTSSAGRADTFTGLKVLGGGYDVTQLTQDVSQKSDLVSKLGDYVYELITVELKLTAGFAFAGNGFVAANAESATITGNSNLKFRIPAATTGKPSIADELGLSVGCTIEISNTPLWRFSTQAQVSANDKAEVKVKSCPLPEVKNASALTATTVSVVFSSPVDAATLLANGSQFSFDNGLVASAAKLIKPNEVEVTTGTQDSTKTYKVTVAVSIKSKSGQALDATKNTASFKGFGSPKVPAKVLINEVAPHIASGCDLIELRIMADVQLQGWKLQERNSTTGLITFPSMAVKKNDIIVIHMDKNDTKCNPGGAGNETTSKNQNPKAQFAANYDSAYDLYSDDKGITATDNVITLYDKSGKIVDAVFLADSNKAGKTTASSASVNTSSQANAVAAAKEWKPVSGPAPASYTNEFFNQHAAAMTNSSSGKITDNSAQRKSNTDTDSRADWNLVAPTIGLLNVGQTALP